MRVVLAYKLSTEQFLVVSGPVLYGFIGAAALWTFVYRRRSRRKLERLIAGQGGGLQG